MTTLKYSLFSKLVTAGVFLALAACQAKVPGNAQEEAAAGQADEIMLSDEQVRMAGIVSGKMQQRTLSLTLSCNGTVEVPLQSLVSVSLPMEGYVREVRLYPGSKVSKGDLLAVMEHPVYLDLQREYMVSGNNLDLLKQDLDRQEILAKEDAASEKKLMQARTEYRNTLVDHTALGEQLRLLGLDPAKLSVSTMSSRVKVYSPIDGFVRENYANTGELIKAGDPIMDLEDVSHLHVHLVIYEKDINRVRAGQKVEFSTGGGPRRYSGTVHTVGKSIDREIRSADVHVHISDPDAALLSGMYVKARILLESRTVYALPDEGIVADNGQGYVFLREGNNFRRVPVETGIRQDGYTEIASAESLLEKEIVHAGAYYLNAGLLEEE